MKSDGLRPIRSAENILVVIVATFSSLFAEVLILGTKIRDLKLECLAREDVFLPFYHAYLSKKLKHTHTPNFGVLPPERNPHK